MDAVTFAVHPVEMSDFMAEIERHFGDLPEGHWLELSPIFGLTVTQFREETVEEYTKRVEAKAAYDAEVKQKASSSWERQKRKFAKARKNT